MSILISIGVWFVIYRFIVGKFRTWIESDRHVIDYPLPLWLYLVFAALAAVPAFALVMLLP